MANRTGMKFGGRKKGTPNKINKELRAVLKEFLETELGNLGEHLKGIPPKERLEIMVKLLPYVLPKLESVPQKEDTETEDKIEGFVWPTVDNQE